jgi:type I restriction enzyme S subunit
MVVPPISGSVGAATTEVHVVRAKPGLADPRFLMYRLLTKDFLEEGVSQFQGVAGLQRVPAEFLRDLPVADLRVEEQRRIADFLDDQVARIDGLKSARAQQTALAKEQSLAELDGLLGGTAVRPLQTFTDPTRPIQYGIVLPGPDWPGGIPIIKGGDVAAGRMSLDLLNRTDPEIEARYPRSRLIPGDLVMSIRGSSGEVAVVPDELDGANLTQDAARIAVRDADARWLRWVLQTPAMQGAIQQRVTGAMVTGINIESLRHLLLPDPPRAEQRHLGLAAESLMQQSASHIEILKASTVLLEERKRSLITAAVTGELDVTTARPIGMGKWVPNVGVGLDTPAAAQASSIGGIG